MGSATFWSRRPSPARALAFLALAVLTGTLLAAGASRVTPFVVRSHLRAERGGLEPLYLTRLDEGRVLLTTRRENSTWSRDRASQGGDPYWVRRYSDPARPGLQKRILLTSRSRGAHLLIPLGALDLERALSTPVQAGAESGAGSQPPRLRCELRRVYWNRSFAGIFLQLRFPERTVVAGAPGKRLGFDLVVVRGNAVRTTDFLLQPNAELYRSLLTAGRRPTGDLRRNPATGDESVMMLREDAPATGLALFSPVSLFDELGLCWGTELGTLVDDRWDDASASPYALQPPAAETRARVLQNGEIHLAARLEPAGERRALAAALARFAGS